MNKNNDNITRHSSTVIATESATTLSRPCHLCQNYPEIKEAGSFSLVLFLLLPSLSLCLSLSLCHNLCCVQCQKRQLHFSSSSSTKAHRERERQTRGGNTSTYNKKPLTSLNSHRGERGRKKLRCVWLSYCTYGLRFPYSRRERKRLTNLKGGKKSDFFGGR